MTSKKQSLGSNPGSLTPETFSLESKVQSYPTSPRSRIKFQGLLTWWNWQKGQSIHLRSTYSAFTVDTQKATDKISGGRGGDNGISANIPKIDVNLRLGGRCRNTNAQSTLGAAQNTPSPTCVEAVLPGRHQRPGPPAPDLPSFPSWMFCWSRTSFRVSSFKKDAAKALWNHLPCLLLAPCARSSAMSRMITVRGPLAGPSKESHSSTGATNGSPGTPQDNDLEPNTQALGRSSVALAPKNGTSLSGCQGQVCFPKRSQPLWVATTCWGASLVAQSLSACLQCGRLGFDPWVGKISCVEGLCCALCLHCPTHSSQWLWTTSLGSLVSTEKRADLAEVKQWSLYTHLVSIFLEVRLWIHSMALNFPAVWVWASFLTSLCQFPPLLERCLKLCLPQRFCEDQMR